jgi:lipopolysaccharide transport system ATP-binding protein
MVYGERSTKMSEIAIHAEGLSKQYRRGQREGYTVLRDVLAQTLRAPWSLFRRAPPEVFWALKDVSLDVKQGEVLGLIGRNGAGKTTFLKILSRITKPTAGWADIHGRVGSLLEVGTGFHPELTGRENTFLSGAILGMGKKEIERKFDEIVAFAELEKFIDTPVKHYSSGMYVRLAFAVAAHLEPEILLVDEVLAVGDIRFQKKCLGKMGEVGRSGRTVILVSHQLNQIRRLCERVVWVDDGAIRLNGSTHEVLSSYELAMFSGDRSKGLQRGAGISAQFLRWEIEGSQPDKRQTLSTLGPVTMNFVLEVARPVGSGEHGVALYNAERQLMWAHSIQGLVLQPGVHVLSLSLPSLPLRPGPYQWQVSFWDNQQLFDLWDCLPEMTIATKIHQHRADEWNGLLNVPCKFSVRNQDENACEAKIDI